MIQDDSSYHDQIQSILQVAIAAFKGNNIPYSEIPPALADHLAITTVAISQNDRVESEQLLKEVIERMYKTFNEYWDGSLNEEENDPSLN